MSAAGSTRHHPDYQSDKERNGASHARECVQSSDQHVAVLSENHSCSAVELFGLLPFELVNRRLTRIPNEEQVQQSTQFEASRTGSWSLTATRRHGQ
jgi:hypothetical protein